MVVNLYILLDLIISLLDIVYTIIMMIRLYDYYEPAIVFFVNLLVVQKKPPMVLHDVITPECAVLPHGDVHQLFYGIIWPLPHVRIGPIGDSSNEEVL